MIHFSEYVKLVELVTLQVMFGSYGHNAYLEETHTLCVHKVHSSVQRLVLVT